MCHRLSPRLRIKSTTTVRARLNKNLAAAYWLACGIEQLFRLPVEQVFADRRDHLHTYAALFEVIQYLHQIHRQGYRHSVPPPEAYYDLLIVSTGTRRMWPVRMWVR
jgi:hypothetical protein